MPYDVTKLLTWLASPLGVFTVGLAAAWLARALPAGRTARLRRLGRALGVLGTVQLLAFSCYPVAELLLRPLEEHARQQAAAAPKGGYAVILVLGGVLQPPPQGSHDDPELNQSVDRLWRAAHLYRQGLAPRILVSGGSHTGTDGRPLLPEAEAMKQVLITLGVPAGAIDTEIRSQTTRGNVVESARLIGPGQRVALVTSGFHMRRALTEARAAGIEAHAFPADFEIPAGGRPWFQQYLPNPDALRLATIVIKEWEGIFAQREFALDQAQHLSMH